MFTRTGKFLLAQNPLLSQRTPSILFRNLSEQSNVKRLFVGNLPYRAREGDLRTLFERFGEVKYARVIVDKETRRSRGYGFVEIEANTAADAIKELNSSNFQGRQIFVSEARERSDQGRDNMNKKGQDNLD